MLTIFTIPKPFRNQINIIQKNAIKSWIQLQPKCEIILFGDDEGTAETAKEFHVLHIATIEKNKFGTPLLNAVFQQAQKSAQNETLLYVNADIILTYEIVSSTRQIKKTPFLICGRRWDLDIKEEIDFEVDGWQDQLIAKVHRKGRLHGPSGIDYFIFPRNLPINMPPFAVGRQGWDSWLIYHMRSNKIAVIDATEAIMVIHQNHDYSHSKFEEKNRVGGPEVMQNLALAGGLSCMFSLRDADWILSKTGLKKPGFPRRILPLFSLFYPWRFLLAIKRKTQRLCAHIG